MATFKRRIVIATVGENQRQLAFVSMITAGGMQHSAVEKQHVAGIQLRTKRLMHQVAIFLQISSKKLLIIKLLY